MENVGKCDRHLEVTVTWSECGLDLFKHSSRSRGPFYSAIAAGHKFTIQYLLRLEDDPRFPKPEKREKFLKVAATNGFEDIVQMLIIHQFAADNLMEKRYTVEAKLVNAGYSGKEDLVTELLPLARPDYDVPDHHGCSMLMYAAINRLEHAVEYLLEKGADINRLGNCPEVNADPDKSQTALLLATFKNHFPIVHRLLQCPDVVVNLGFVYGADGMEDEGVLYGLMQVARVKKYADISRLLEDHLARETQGNASISLSSPPSLEQLPK